MGQKLLVSSRVHVRQVCVVSGSVVHIPLVSDKQGMTHNILCILNPLYPLMGCLSCIATVRIVYERLNIFEYKPSLGWSVDRLIFDTQAAFLPSSPDQGFVFNNMLVSVFGVSQQMDFENR